MRFKLTYFLIFAIGLSYPMNGQLNDYKYIIVPKKFDAFKKENKHQTSTIIKHLFTQNGFTAVYEDALPEDLANNRCLGLLVNLEDNSSLFSTKTVLVLRDCQSIEVFRSLEGRSKIKEYKAAYREAIKGAFTSFEGMGYTYTPKKETSKEVEMEQPITVSFKNDVKSLDKKPEEKVMVQEATTENQTFKSIKPAPSTIKRAENVVKKTVNSNLLYAQPIEGGYQLVDSTPKVVLKIVETSVENIFLVDYEGKNGVVFKKEDKWFLEYTENGAKKLEELNIKF
ncbi:hypothetical protein [Flagellimonas sp.]|uniref:hypothetical protein n=1 Tax=Flagellimonas sp. TaxID=2058762 RepID=UPI003B598E65